MHRSPAALRFAHFRDPLGPVSVGRTTLPHVTRIVAGLHCFLALTESAALLRSADGGVSWNECKLPASPGVNIGVFMQPDGSGQALRVPQQLLETGDDGLTWTLLITAVGAPTTTGSRRGDRFPYSGGIRDASSDPRPAETPLIELKV